jgi:hypothetical protein
VPKALTFWQTPDEETEFLDFLDTTGVVVAYPSHWVQTGTEVLPLPVRAFLLEKQPRQVLLGLERADADAIISPQVDGTRPYLSVDFMSSCLIAYSRAHFEPDGRLGKANLSTYLDFLAGTEIKRKPVWFQSWVKKVFTWARKHANKKCVLHGFEYPATPLVKKLVEEKRIELDV